MKESLAQKGLVVIEPKNLQLQDFLLLIKGKVLAIRIPDFYPNYMRRHLTSQLLRGGAFDHYRMAQDVGVYRMGMTLFETENDPEHLTTYYDTAVSCSQQIRELCLPYLNPLDWLRLQLEEIWPEGANIENIHGQKMHPGIIRKFEKGEDGGLPPHQDILHRDVPDVDRSWLMKNQLAANIYLSVPQDGGELELWEKAPSEDEFSNLMMDHHDFMDRQKLPSPSAVIKPKKGELVLFSTNCIHAVRRSYGKSRIAASCFIGYYGVDKALTYWA